MDSFSSLQSFTSIIMLDVNGSNWSIFKRKFKTYIVSVGLDKHFQENDAPAENYEDDEAKLIKKGNESNNDFQKCLVVWEEGKAKWEEGIRVWKKDDTKAKAALGKVIPNSIHMEFSELETF